MTDYKNLTEKEASALIAEKIREAEKAISEAESIADATGVRFSINIGGYGMGGWYRPNPSGSGGNDEDRRSSDDYGWQASSQSC